MISITPLTKRQRELYDYIVAYLHAAGYAPTLGEMRKALGLSSLATVHKHLANLSDRGYITRSWNRARSVTLLVGLGCCPLCGQALNKEGDNTKVPLETGRKVCNDKAVEKGLAGPIPT